MSDFWYPGAEHDDQGSDGGSMTGGPPRVTFHTTEGYSHRGGRDHYHFTIGFEGDSSAPGTGALHVTQWRTLARAGLGLRNPSGGVQTNRRGETHAQIAFAWEASKIAEIPHEAYQAAADLVAWLNAEHGVSLWSRYAVGLGSEAYGENGPARMAPGEWDSFDGICAHQEVPENTHWDCGKFDFAKLIDLAKDEPEPAPGPPPNEGDVIAARVNSTQGISFAAWWHRPIWLGQSPPPDPIVGSIWINQTENELRSWSGTEWVLFLKGVYLS